MYQEGALLEGHIRDSALEGPQNGRLNGGLAPVLDWPIQVGSRLPSYESCLELVDQAVERAGG